MSTHHPLRPPNPPAYTPALTKQPDMTPLASAEPHVAQLCPSCSHCWPTSMCGTSSQQLGDPLDKEVDWVYPAQRWASSGYKRGTVEPHVALPMPRGSCRVVLSVSGYMQVGLVAVGVVGRHIAIYANCQLPLFRDCPHRIGQWGFMSHRGPPGWSYGQCSGIEGNYCYCAI